MVFHSVIINVVFWKETAFPHYYYNYYFCDYYYYFLLLLLLFFFLRLCLQQVKAKVCVHQNLC